MSRTERRATVRIVAVVAVALTVVGAGAVGLASAQSGESYSLWQDGRCTAITPLSGTESVKAFYGYNLPYPENPYATGLNESYSSERTTDLQENETSLLFLYLAPDGNLSLVVIHGTWGLGTDGGAASFEIDGLPAEGTWAVKDDLYNNSHNYDRWNHTPTSAEVDWTWSGNATDGGAYAGLGDDFRITIDPAFNEEAALSGQYYNGTVEDWQVLSGDRTDPERISLDLSERATISTEACDGSRGAADDGPKTASGGGASETDGDSETTEDETETTGERTERSGDERETDDGDRTDGPNRDDGDNGDDDRTEGSDDRDTERSPDSDRGRSDGDPFDDDWPFDGDGPFDGEGPFDGGGPFDEESPSDGEGPFGDDGPFDASDPFDGNVTEG